MNTDVAVVIDIPGRGQGLKAARNVTAGEVILSDLPILIAQNDVGEFCTACLRALAGRNGEQPCTSYKQPDPLLNLTMSDAADLQCQVSEIVPAFSDTVACHDCGQATFCSGACERLAQEDPAGHSPAVCRQATSLQYFVASFYHA